MHKINLSGHPVSGFDSTLVGVNLPMEDAATLVTKLTEVLLAHPCREGLLHGEAAEVVLPGMAPAAAIALAVWHGQFGQFPAVRWAVRGKEGAFTWPEAARCDLQNVRTEARTVRA